MANLLVPIGFALGMLLIRPSDRSRALLLFSCSLWTFIAVALAAVTAAGAIRLGRPSEAPERWSLAVISLLCGYAVVVAPSVAWLHCRHGPVVKDMHLALLRLWRQCRLIFLFIGITEVVLGAYKLLVFATKDFQDPFRYGHQYDVLVGLLFVTLSATLSPRTRLKLQLSRSPARILDTLFASWLPQIALQSDYPDGVFVGHAGAGHNTSHSIGNSASDAGPLTASELKIWSSRSHAFSEHDLTLRPPRICLDGAAADGDLELLRMIGKGSFGTVYAARLRGSGEPFAIKLFTARQGRSGRHRLPDLETLLNEFELAMSIEHTNICATRGTAVVRSLQSTGTDGYGAAHHSGDASQPTPWPLPGRHPALVMELVEGGNLDALVHGPRDQKTTHSPPPLALRARLAYELAVALTYLHSHEILHCDVKLTNVLLTAEPDPHVKLCDFGLSVELEQNELVYGVRGTPRYMAPEVAFRGYGLPADVYSFGICLYELLHGVRFLAEFARPYDVIMTVLNGDRRPCAHLSTERRAALSAANKRFADAAATVIEQCWQLDWEQRPTMADVTMRLLLRRGTSLGESDWKTLEQLAADQPPNAAIIPGGDHV